MNEERKQAVIKAAYAPIWHLVEPFIHMESGECYGDRMSSKSFPVDKAIEAGFKEEFEHCGPISKFDYWRPVALRGIRNNNGWIRFDDQLPPPEMQCDWCYTDNLIIKRASIWNKGDYLIERYKGVIMHYPTPSHWRQRIMDKPLY